MSFGESLGNIFGSLRATTVEHAPQILVTTGALSIIAGTVLTIKNSTKVAQIVNDRKQAIEELKLIYDESNEEEYTEETFKDDIRKINLSTAISLTKTIAPRVGLIALGALEMGLGAHEWHSRYDIANSRAMYISSAFMAYMTRNKELFGEDNHNAIMYGIEKRKVTISETDPETGEVKTKKETMSVATNPYGVSRYAVYFDSDTTEEFDRNDLQNEGYIMGIQAQANDRLQYGTHRKVLLLNEVYEMLGVPQTVEGSKVGWSLDSDGDHQVIFNVMQVAREDYEGADTYHKCYLIDFNVDGSVEKYLMSYNFNKVKALEMRK